MLNAINVPTQVVESKENVLFNVNRIKTGCGVSHDAGSGRVRISKCGLYRVGFVGNVSGTVADQTASLAIEIEGEPLASATSLDTITTLGDFRSVSLETIVCVNGKCCVDVTVANVATTNALNVQNASIIVERIG